MAATSTLFRTAADLASKQPEQRSRTVEELEARIAAQDELIERQLQYIQELEQGQTAPQEQKPLPKIRDDERLKLIADFIEARKETTEQIKTIKEQFDGMAANQNELIALLRDRLVALTKTQDDDNEARSRDIMNDRKRISTLEQRGSYAVDGKTVKLHLDGLYDHMKSVGLVQVTFHGAAKILGITKQRVHQFKPSIALDQRFIIIPSESHRQKELIRLREVHNKI